MEKVYDTKVYIKTMFMFIETEMPSFWQQFLSLPAPQAVILTTSGAASDENFNKITRFLSRCYMSF